MVTTLEPLLALQERDLALDRLRHQRETLPERATLSDAEAAASAVSAELAAVRAARDEVVAEELKLDEQAQSFAGQADEHERRLYSGEVASPRDLQALQSDVEQLRRRQRELEDQSIAAMERREPLDAEVTRVEGALEQATSAIERARAALSAAEAEVDREAAGEKAARDEVAAGIDAELVTDYEKRRAKGGTGAARLVGNTCQACHLTIPATEVDRIRKMPPGTVAYCDNCGAILVP